MKMKKNNVIVILLILLIIIIFGITIFLLTNENLDKNKEKNVEEIINNKTVETLTIEDTNNIGYLKINSINLYAPIKDGTELNVLKEAIGHFTNTSYLSGNICLAAHNRGNNQNFFENLKNVELNAEISYITKYS